MSISRVSLLVVVALLYMENCNTASIPRNYDPRMSDEMVLTPKKRPFCNAFTGCGRKRSQAAPGMPSQELRQKQIARSFDPRLSDEMILSAKKRPFCNIFNGCHNSKRSQARPGNSSPEVMRQKQYPEYETFGSEHTNLNTEIALEELSHQIVTEERFWEAIRDASAAIARRKQIDN